MRPSQMTIVVPALMSLSSASLLSAQSPGLWIDSVSGPGYYFGVSGSSSDVVRVVLRVGPRLSEISARGEEVKQFGDSAALLLTKAPPPTETVSYAVAGAKLRMTYSVERGVSVVRFGVDGDRGVEVQPTLADAMRFAGILRGAAFWSVEQSHAASRHIVVQPGAPDGAYFEFQVERPAAQSGSNPPPTYPPMLRSANVEGQVLVQFAVDTLGRADMATFYLLKSTHDLFTTAVKDVLPRYKFRPAQLGGRKVKQVVQMPFDFSISP
jgi:TonB family protein